MNDNQTASTVAMRPVQQSERIHILDIMRGFAIFGILAVNGSVDLLGACGHSRPSGNESNYERL